MDQIIQNQHLTTNVWELGAQSWYNSRLRYLSLSNNLNLISVPSSIGTLNSLENLYLNNNELSSLPNTLCDLPSNCEIFIMNNNLCEEYHFDCIDHWEPQECQE